jgi:ABC-2 type transport system ATP-binding protein
MQQRLCLARALIHDPDVLLLDEPASGLDPRARVEFRELLRTLQGMGKTVVISSHILLELAEMCSDIAIIRAGQLVMAGSVEQVTHSLGGGNQIEVRVLERATDAKQLLKEMAEISNLLNENEDGEVIQAEFSGDNQALHRILAELMAHDIPVVSFAPRRAVDRLEEVYMSITEGASAI